MTTAQEMSALESTMRNLLETIHQLSALSLEIFNVLKQDGIQLSPISDLAPVLLAWKIRRDDILARMKEEQQEIEEQMAG